MQIFQKITCKHCNYQSYSGIKMLMHICIHHKDSPTKKDVRFAFSNGVESKIILFPVAILALGFYCICWPAHKFCEWIEGC